MIRTQVYLPEDLYNEAQLTSRLYATNISRLIRLGLPAAIQEVTRKSYKKSDKKAWDKFIGACKTDFGGKSGQELIDDYYLNDVV